MIHSILSTLLADSPIHQLRFSESVTDLKYIVKVVAVFWFSETVLSLSVNVILEPPCECLFEKFGLPKSSKVFQNFLVAVSCLIGQNVVSSFHCLFSPLN